MTEEMIKLNTMSNEELIQENLKLKQTVDGLRQTVDSLKQMIEWFKRQIFGQKSERFIEESPDQMLLGLDIEAAEVAPETFEVPAHLKRRPAKGKEEFKLDFPDDIPVEEVIHDLPPEKRVCPATGKEMVEMGREHVDKLACTPASFFLKRNIYIKYAVPSEPLSKVRQAPAPPCIIEGSKFDPSFMAYVSVAKFGFHMPLNRIQEKLAMEHIRISRQTLSSLLMRLGEKALPLYDLMKKRLFEGGVIFTDDTPVMMIVKGMGKAVTGRIWIYLGGAPNAPPFHVYDFTGDWSHRHPMEFLKDFKGHFHSDAYEAYGKIDASRADVHWAACWAHARRGFEECVKFSNCQFSMKILRMMRNLFRFERIAWAGTPERRLKIRQEKETPIVEDIFGLMRKELGAPDLLPSSRKYKAVTYMLGRKKNFMLYLDNPDLRMDNNPAERALRKVCLGKKNWMFVGSLKAGDSAAVLFSLIQTCRAMKINPQQYLEDIFTRLMDHPARKLDELLPDKWLEAQEPSA